MIRLEDRYSYCRDRFDELCFGVGRTISSIKCNNERQEEMFLNNEGRHPKKISTCFSFSLWHFWQTEDERKTRWRSSPMSAMVDVFNSDRWDEHEWLNFITGWTFEKTSRHELSDESYFVPSTCPSQSHRFLCHSSLVFPLPISNIFSLSPYCCDRVNPPPHISSPQGLLNYPPFRKMLRGPLLSSVIFQWFWW